MATIEIPNVRQESTVLMPTTLKDNGVAVDWSGLQNIKAYMYSDAQRVIAGKCDVEVDGEDATVLKVTYAATRPQYLGVNSLLVRCKYHGREKSYDVPVLNFVERTAQATGVTVLDDPVIDVKLEVNEVSTSLLDGAIAAALDAAAHAEEAAEAAEKKAQEQADWAQNDPYKVDYIKNKPEIPTNVVKYTQQILHPTAQAQARSNIGAGTYSKPGTGIPYNDLDEETRQAIEAADTTRVFYYDASTFEEVNDAISDGFVVIVDMEGVQLMHSGYDETKGIAFTGHSADDPDVLLCAYVNNSDEWSSEERPRDAEAVKYTSQTLTSAQKEQARTNIAAAAAAAISELTAAIAAKYSKPANGIPSSDMDAAVQSALAKANSAIQDLSAYYTKTQVDQLLAAVNAQNYETVSTLPTASASTMGKIYLVGPDTNGYYAYYFSSYNGSAYSWVGPLGTTEINLAGYATKEELSQLDQELVLSDTIRKEKEEAGYINNAYIFSGTRKIGTSSGDAVYYLPIKNGQTITAKFVLTGGYFICGFAATLPENGTDITQYSSTSSSATEKSLTATADGYFVCALTKNKLTSLYFLVPNEGFGKEVKDAIETVDNKIIKLDEQSAKLAARQNYSSGGYFNQQVIVAANGWNITDFIPLSLGEHTIVWNFGYGEYTASNGPCLCFFDDDKIYSNYITSVNQGKDTRVFKFTNSDYAFIRASFYDTLGDGTPNTIPVIIDGAPYFIHGKISGIASEEDKRWKPLQLGKLLNCDTSSGQLNHSTTYDPIRVTMQDALAPPKVGAKIRLIQPKIPYRMNVYFWYGDSAGTITTTTGSSMFDGTEWTMPSTVRAFRIVLRVTSSYASSPGWQIPVSAEDVQAWLNSGEMRLDYYDDGEDVGVRNLADEAMVQALRRNLPDNSHLANARMDNFPIFAHISDLHGDATRFKNLMDYVGLIGGIDAVLNSGDAVLYLHRDSTTYIEKITSEHNTPMLMCIGNHEASPTGVSTLFADNIQGLVSQGYLKATDTPADHCYYYMDFTEKSIRVIVLNYYEDGVYAGRLGQTQITWFVNTLLSTPAGYGILVMLHSPEDAVDADAPLDKFIQPSPKFGDTYQPNGFYVGSRPIMKIVDAFIGRTTISESYDDHSATYDGNTDTTTESVTITADFSEVDESTEFIAYICGHRHEDNIGYYQHSTEKQLCLDIVCGNALFGDSSNAAWSNQCDLPRGGVGTAQDAFNIYAIDRANGNVRVVRIGANVTIKFERRDMMIIPYK